AVNGDALAVAWPTMATGPLEVQLALSAREGAAVAPPGVIDVGDAVLGRVDVAPWRDGGFLISGVGGDTGRAVLHVAEVDVQGVVGERRDVVRLPPGRQLGHPRLASHDGRGMVAWTEPQADGPRVRVAWVE
ncbi:MAG: hypothetical protein ACRC2H_04865, partial [Silanimonas sp.]